MQISGHEERSAAIQLNAFDSQEWSEFVDRLRRRNLPGTDRREAAADKEFEEAEEFARNYTGTPPSEEETYRSEDLSDCSEEY